MKSQITDTNTDVFSRYTAWIVFGVCILLVGLPLHWMPSDAINPDAYLHVALANYYLLSNEGGIRDALTSGPVIPFIYTILKAVGMLIFTWTPRADVVLIKLFAFICYLMIALGSTKLIAEKASARTAVTTVAFILGFMGTGMDLLSPNGELVSVTFLIWLLVLLRWTHTGIAWHIGVAALSMVVIATKIQAAPLLALIVCSDARIWRNWKLLLAVFVPLFLVVELTFYFNGAGIAHNLKTLLRYVMEGVVTIDQSPILGGSRYEILRKTGEHLGWVASNVLANFPIFFMIVVGLVCAPMTLPRPIVGHWLVWMLVTMAVIFAPGRPFPHYVILALPFIARYSG